MSAATAVQDLSSQPPSEEEAELQSLYDAEWDAFDEPPSSPASFSQATATAIQDLSSQTPSEEELQSLYDAVWDAFDEGPASPASSSQVDRSFAGDDNGNPVSSQRSLLVHGHSLPDLTDHLVKRDIYPAAHGGFADVWVCSWTPGQGIEPKKVAVKVLRTVNNDANGKRKLERRLRRELSVWLSLTHPQVLPLYGVASEFGPYVSMVCPWMENGNLNAYLSKYKISLGIEERYKILRQVCSGLTYLHSRFVVHGDLTGCNVLIDLSGNARLSDFGLSTIVSDLQGASTLTTSIGGNVRFAAPELYRIGAEDDVLPRPTAQSDIYSFGSITLQTLTGRIPYHYMRTDGQVLIELARGRQPRRPATSVITDARWLFLCACWANKPSDRPDVESIEEYLLHLDNVFMTKRTPLRPLDNIRLLSLLNVSHTEELESWTASSNDQSVVAQVFQVPPSDEERLTTIQGLQMIGKVQHKNILTYLGISVTDNKIATIMPWNWLEHRTLCSHLHGSSIPVAQRLVMIQQVALALTYLHSLLIVHGGLTGWNVLVDHTGSIKLSNYGLMPFIFQRAPPQEFVRAYDDDFRWADPALWFPRDTPRPNISRESDVFAYGRIIFQLLTSKPPFQGKSLAGYEFYGNRRSRDDCK